MNCVFLQQKTTFRYENDLSVLVCNSESQCLYICLTMEGHFQLLKYLSISTPSIRNLYKANKESTHKFTLKRLFEPPSSKNKCSHVLWPSAPPAWTRAIIMKKLWILLECLDTQNQRLGLAPLRLLLPSKLRESRGAQIGGERLHRFFSSWY